MAFCRSFAFFFLHKISQPSWFFKHDTFTSLILLMGHTIKMNASTNGADFDTPAQPQRTTRTWQISFLERVCKMSSESCCKTQPPLSPKWCLPSTNAQFSGANPNSSWGGAGGRGGKRKNVLPTAAVSRFLLPFRLGCQTGACFGRLVQQQRRKHSYAARYNIIFLHYTAPHHVQRMQSADVITFAVACGRLNNRALVPRRTSEQTAQLNPRPPGQECSPSSRSSH